MDPRRTGPRRFRNLRFDLPADDDRGEGAARSTALGKLGRANPETGLSRNELTCPTLTATTEERTSAVFPEGRRPRPRAIPRAAPRSPCSGPWPSRRQV